MGGSGEGRGWEGVGKGEDGREWGRERMGGSGEGRGWEGVGKGEDGRE